jgi:hypothetical protein
VRPESVDVEIPAVIFRILGNTPKHLRVHWSDTYSDEDLIHEVPPAELAPPIIEIIGPSVRRIISNMNDLSYNSQNFFFYT